MGDDGVGRRSGTGGGGDDGSGGVVDGRWLVETTT